MHAHIPEAATWQPGPIDISPVPPPGSGGVNERLPDHFIVRIEGTLLINGISTPPATAWLRGIAGRFALISSNSRDTARTMTAKLRRAGIVVPEDTIVLAGEEALRLAAARFPGARCQVLASRVLAHAARSHGLDLVHDNPDVIVLGRDSAWTYQDLRMIVNELARGAKLVVSNGDAAFIGNSGRIIPDTGAILAAVELAAGEASAGIIRLSRAAMLRAAQARIGNNGEAVVISAQAADYECAVGIPGLKFLPFLEGPTGTFAQVG